LPESSIGINPNRIEHFLNYRLFKVNSTRFSAPVLHRFVLHNKTSHWNNKTDLPEKPNTFEQHRKRR
jgi:hypothetical protein